METVGDLLRWYLDYGRRERRWRHFVEIERRVDHYLYRLLANVRLTDVNADVLREYANHRSVEGVGPVTISGELGSLRQALRLASLPVPPMPTLPARTVDETYLDPATFVLLRAALSRTLQLAVTIGYVTAWPLSPLLSLRWSGFSARGIAMRVPTGTLRYPFAGYFGFAFDVEGMVKLQRRSISTGCRFVFPGRRTGRPMSNIAEQWNRARRIARVDCVPGDLAMSARRNFAAAGLDPTAAAAISMPRAAHEKAADQLARDALPTLLRYLEGEAALGPRRT